MLTLAFAAALFTSTRTYAVPLYCYTNYIQNSGFDYDGAWTYSTYAYRETAIDDPCDTLGYLIKAAALKNGNDSISQTFTTTSQPSLGWSVTLSVQTSSIAGASAWDEIKILAQNLTTGQSEVVGLIKGTQLTSTCQRFDFNLTKDYTNAQVRLTINSQPFTSLDVYIDNVAFFGRYC